ncbi:MAG TPA: cysteine--tRNA ligase [Thermoplasmata archaeon]|nr:cysteine--tRNA ligase [Thermoplasmata archaeon]
MRRFELYDTLGRERRSFQPITPPKVGLFVCGLTPYAPAHIGHARVAVFFDVVARALARWGYRVFYIQNVTNLDDKIIERGGSTGTDPLVLADRHFRAWTESMDALGVRSVNYYPHATDYIPEIQGQVRALIDRGLAYAAEGSVYYDVAKFPGYGRLSGQRTESLRPGTRPVVERGKRAPEDFALWKAAKPGEPSWESPWGPGRPGWHIEDTAITVRLLGARYDIHGAGADLKFPHHEAEIAQAEGATGESPLVNFWMHVGLLTMGGQKMSKSLGNVYGLDEAIVTYGGEVLRFYYLNAQYRGPLDFVGGRTLEEARDAYATLSGPARRIAAARGRAGDARAGDELSPATFEAANAAVVALDAQLADDFNTREAIAQLFTWGRTVGPFLGRLEALSSAALDALEAPYRWGAEVLGLFGSPAPAVAESGPLAVLVDWTLAERKAARERGDFAHADRLRELLQRAGIVVEDRGSETAWHLAPPGQP